MEITLYCKREHTQTHCRRNVDRPTVLYLKFVFLTRSQNHVTVFMPVYVNVMMMMIRCTVNIYVLHLLTAFPLVFRLRAPRQNDANDQS